MAGSVISISSSDPEASDFENDVPDTAAFASLSSPALRARPDRPRVPASKLPVAATAGKRKCEVTVLVSSDDSDLPPTDQAFGWTNNTATKQQRSSPLVQVDTRSPPLKKAKSASKALEAINAFTQDPTIWQAGQRAPNAVASTSASATLPAPARRTASAPTGRGKPIYSDVVDDTSEIQDFTEGPRSEDLDIDVWEERQRMKLNGKGKERELINGAGPSASTSTQDKIKVTRGKKGKTDEEKAAELAEKARKKAEADAVKAKAKAEALLDKERKSIMKDANKLRSSKTETFKEIIVDVSSSSKQSAAFARHIPILQAHLESKDSSLDYFGSLLDRPPASLMDEVLPTDYSPPTILKFRRRLKARYSEVDKTWIPIPDGPILMPEKTAVVYLTAQELVDHLEPVNTLLGLPSRVRESLDLGPKASVMVIVQGLDALYRKKKTSAKRDFANQIRANMGASSGSSAPRLSRDGEEQMGREEIEKQLVRLQIAERCFITCAETDEEVLIAIVSIAGDVAHRPYKLIERSHLGFSAHNNKGKSHQDTFCKMLEQIPRVTAGVSKAVQGGFPTVRSLMESYDQLEGMSDSAKNEQASMMLSELLIGHRVDGVPNQRKINKALSKRIHGLVRGEDGEMLVDPS